MTNLCEIVLKSHKSWNQVNDLSHGDLQIIPLQSEKKTLGPKLYGFRNAQM